MALTKHSFEAIAETASIHGMTALTDFQRQFGKRKALRAGRWVIERFGNILGAVTKRCF
jgi:hypothetical protein